MARRAQTANPVVTRGRRRREPLEREGAPAPHVAFDGLDRLRVVDAMHPGLISCPVDTPLRTVARMMATYRVHAILVSALGKERLAGGGMWGVISDTDLLRAAQAGELTEQTARAVAATPALTLPADDDLAHAAQLMLEQGASHLIVTEPRSPRPIGVLSTLDLTRALARFPERHPVTF